MFLSDRFLTGAPSIHAAAHALLMLVLGEVTSASGPRWRPLRVDSKAALPIEDLVVVAGRCGARQLTALGGRVKASSRRLLLVLPLPVDERAATPAIQVLELGECAVQLLQDVRACFPSLVRKNPLAAAPSDESDDSEEEEEEEEAAETRRRRREEKEAKEKRDAAARLAAEARSISPGTAAFLASTRVRVLPSVVALGEAYSFHDDVVVKAIQSEVEHYLEGKPTVSAQCLCLEFPANESADAKELNFGVVFAHDQDDGAAHYLHIPLLREPRGYFPTASENDDVVFQDATVFTFNSKRESSEHGGGKTSAETVKNIRLRHASGTFNTLVYPSLNWEEVSHKYGGALPQLVELRGELRSRRFMGIVPNRPVEILLET